MHNIKVHVGDQ